MVSIVKGNFGVGVGLRREISKDLLQSLPSNLDCLEIAPENYLNTGGKLFREFKKLAERYPILFHSISFSVGSLNPLDWDYLKAAKKFIKAQGGQWMSDHLCYSSVLGAQFHDLLPLPFSAEAVDHVVPRIRQIQDFFEMPFAIENISYYAHPGKPEMKEWEFLKTVLEVADCALLLDVNNIYVNSVNHAFDPYEYLKNIPLERVQQVHVAGHRQWEDFLLDTHGADVIDPVWDLLHFVAQRTEIPALILERDHHLPPLDFLLREVNQARDIVHGARKSERLFAAGGGLK